MQLWALPARRPSGKELFMASTHGQPFEKKSWEGSRKEAASLYAASLRQLQTSFSQKKLCSFFVNLGHYDIWFLVIYSICFGLICARYGHLLAWTLPLPLSSCYLTTLAATHKMAAGSLRAGRQRVEAIF